MDAEVSRLRQLLAVAAETLKNVGNTSDSKRKQVLALLKSEAGEPRPEVHAWAMCHDDGRIQIRTLGMRPSRAKKKGRNESDQGIKELASDGFRCRMVRIIATDVAR